MAKVVVSINPINFLGGSFIAQYNLASDTDLGGSQFTVSNITNVTFVWGTKYSDIVAAVKADAVSVMSAHSLTITAADVQILNYE